MISSSTIKPDRYAGPSDKTERTRATSVLIASLAPS